MKFIVSAFLALAVLLAPAVPAGAQTNISQVNVSQLNVSQGTAAQWRPTEGAFFNAARTTVERMYPLEREVIASINHARKGSYIKISLFSFDRFPVADALIQAYRRGVNVQLLFNDHQFMRAQRKLRSVLGNDTTKSSFSYLCRTGCRGSGTLHTKMYLFSHTGAAFNTVMTGSTNMMKNAAVNQFNDLYVDSEAPALYRSFERIFDQMKQDRWQNPNYIKESFGRYQVEYLPYPNASATNDPMMNALNGIRCKGATSAGLTGGRTLVRVNMHVWRGSRGTYLAKKIRSLYAAGCEVKVQYGLAGKPIRDVLKNPTPRGKVPVHINGYDTNESGDMDLYSHQKLLFVRGRYLSNTNANFVWTGSSNWSNNGTTGDEVILRIAGRGLVTSYLKNFNMMWRDFSHQAVWL